MNEHQLDKTFKNDGTCPIESGNLEVVNTFDEDGIRPVAKSSDYLKRDRTTENLAADKTLEIDGKRPIDKSDLKVVETFEEDGTRPIMATNYQVVETLNVDGSRPITSQ